MPDLDFRIEAGHRATLAARGLTSLHACLAFPGDAVVKHALRGRETLRFEAGGGSYFLKRIRGSGWREIRHECRLLQWLGEEDMPVPKPVACGVQQGAAVMVTVALPVVASLEQLLCEERLPPRRLRALMEAAGRLLKRLHEHGVSHRDYYAGHILVGEGDRLFLVDLGRAEVRRRVPMRRVVKDLAAFDFSTPERVAGQELRRHFIATCLGSREPERLRRVEAAVRVKSRRMRRHAERKLARGEPNVHVNA